MEINEAPKANLLGGPENMVTELKTSIFFAAGEVIPGIKQYYQIAKTIAGFINGAGGTLWLGVADDGQVKGVESDLAVLGGGSALPCRGPLANDVDMAFGGTADKYILKIKELVKAFLGPSAERYIAGTQAASVAGKIVVKVPVTKAESGFVAYVYKWHPGAKRYTEEVYQRAANGTSHLEGFARDEFIRGKCREEFKKQLAALQHTAGGLSKDELVAALREMQEMTVVGSEVRIEGAVALDDPHFDALGSPKGLVFDGKHVRDVKGWKGAYEALLKKLNELDAAKFDSLPNADYFKKFFVVAQPRKKYPDYFKSGLGSASNIRAKEVVSKIYFINPSYVVHKLLAHFGIEPRRVGLRGGDGTVDVRKETAPVCETVAPTPTPQSTPSDLVHAFTVKPMMGWLIMNGVKDVENRSKGVNPPKGTCAVSYSKGYTPDEYESDIAYLRDEIGLGERKIKSLPSYEELKPFCGKVVGVVDYEVAEESSSRWYHPGCKAWKMSKPRQIANPFPVTGFVNMWNLKPADAKKILKQL